MRITKIDLLLLMLSAMQLSAQQLYTPRNIKAAYEKGTRAVNGAPGAAYWQNGGDYTIDFRIDAEQKTVSGVEHIVYKNNSPDTLRSLVMRFVNNFHKATAPKAHSVPQDFLTAGLSIKNFAINDAKINTDGSDWETVKPIRLKNKILPGATATIDMEWSYPLSKISGREGQIDAHTFYCAYAYPRVSVYDDYNGWDMLPHTDGQEFYNDFNNYDVRINAPKNYVVWATGVFQNPDEVLQPAAAKRFSESKNADKVIHVATKADMQQGLITTQQPINTWKFKADNITDFCFAASNHYVWDAGSVRLSANGQEKTVSVQAAYNDTAADFKQYVNWEKYCIKWFSENLPGIPYPYPVMTAIQGFADMEYPMMVNDGTLEDLKDSRLTVDHEIAHTYFPFYMGTNETRYAYMDEGWATTFEYLIGMAENGKAYADSAYKSFRVKNWIYNKAAEMDQPLITMSSQLSGGGYGHNSYVKASLSYLALKDLLGDALFKKALHHYMNNWNGKHPMPWDYFYSINTGSGKGLNWFWQNWFLSNNYIDLTMALVAVQKNKIGVTIENTGGFAIPFDIKITYADGTVKTQHYTPAVWQANQKAVVIQLAAVKNIRRLDIETGIFLDANEMDNSWNN